MATTRDPGTIRSVDTTTAKEPAMTTTARITIPTRLHAAYEWIDSAGEWDDAVTDPSYAMGAYSNAVDNDVVDVTVDDLHEVIGMECERRGVPHPGWCVYCDRATGRDDIPASSDDAAWAEVAGCHADGCEWVASRAHRVA